jgi:protease-4
MPVAVILRKRGMNNIYLYRQILKGKWFIHYSYALSMMSILSDIMASKQMGDARDWRGDQTTNLEEKEGRAQFPITCGSTANSVSAYNKFDDAPEGSIALVPMKGVMIKYGTMCEYGTEEIASAMLQAASSPKIDGIVLDIDSGGGAVDAIAPLIEAISKIQKTLNKPVVASADLCASAAYYVACHCDRIVANNNLSSEFGSIGVMMSFRDMQPYYEKLGVKFHKIYAPESNYKNLPLEKALNGEYDMIKEEELSPLAINFQNAVKEKRGSKLKMDVEGILNGRMFYAANGRDKSLEAATVGLIDEVASLDKAIMLAKSYAEMRKILKS